MINNEIQKGLEADARRVKERILMGAMAERARQVAADLAAFIEEHKWSQTKVANKLGVSTAVINQFLQNKYKGSLDEIINKAVNLINSVGRRERRPCNTAYIDTSVAKMIGTVITQTESFSDEEGKIGIIIGDSGHGKSRCLRQYAEANKNTVYVELDDAMTSTQMFAEIADKLGVYSAGSLAIITRKLIDYLQNRHIIIMLDEASGLKVRQLNQLRQVIVTKARCPLILAGNRDLYKTIMQLTNLKGHESLDQFTSRLMYILNLDTKASDKDGGLYTVEDVRKLYEYGGIRLASDAISALRRICKTPRSGRLRTCALVVSALHTAGVVADKGEITAQLIIMAIEQLDLPVRARLPLTIHEEIIEEEKQAVAKAG